MIKKILISGVILGTSLIAFEFANVKQINAEALTNTQQIQAKIASQPKTINLAVATLLSQTPSWASEYLSGMGSDDTYVLGDGHGFMMIPSDGDCIVGEATDSSGKVIHPAENVKDDANATTVGQIKASYKEAIQNNYKQYYPSANYE